ncbi:pilus assembly protein [Caenimonas terrae]|uniref:Pilus assembly protein n=1 Tax=Caenimonas terrae TaxID=696074 RepID=A0ABW0N7V9_9BURK
MKASRSQFRRTVVAAGLLSVNGAFAGSTDIANVPMAVSNMVTPNVLVIYDNSESMDAYMNGVMVSGNNPNTRGNIGRSVMRNAISGYRMAFNWGLMSYEMSKDPPDLRSTYAYYLGSDTGMVFTGNCTGYVAGTFNGAPAVAGTSTAGGRRCIANPQPWPGAEYVTFNYSSDDSNIVDVLYYGSYSSSGVPNYNQMWAPAANTGSNTRYDWFGSHDLNVTTWSDPADFSSSIFSSTLTPTDAGFLPNNSGTSLPNNISRSLYLPRGWGYISDVTGYGKLNEAVLADSTAHYNNLQNLLASESTGTGELKNGAVFTTLKGTLGTARSYFSGSLSGKATPIAQTCQQNFVMLVTDGLPTGDTSGNLYSATDRANSCAWSTASNSCTSGSFGVAATDTISAISSLRTTPVSGVSSINKDGTGAVTGKFDVQTYVVALGDTVANAQALSVMNAMAYNGGTDGALQASDATAFQNAIVRISDDITAKVGAAAAVAVANAHVTSTDNASYASSYNSGTWSGDINASAIDVNTGVPSTASLWTAGSAAIQLDAKTAASRFIVTSTAAAGACGTACGLQFQPTTASTSTTLSVSQQTLLNSPSGTDGAAVVAYLRGDRSGETAGTYRARAHLLGDIINSEPVLVRAPNASYADQGYSAFKTANAGRTRMLFQGSNDGMLHAFVATTGAESWAYVPNLVMGNLNNLSQKPGFTHQYYVDGTPVPGDVDFGNDGSNNYTSDWHTILVGGLGKGGRGYYALDVTTPNASSEVDAKNKVLWEFPNSVVSSTARTAAKLNMGYSFGKPIIVKTAAAGWVVLVTSGYNNGTNTGDSGGDGLGHMFVLNPKTGDLIKDISTASCATTPVSNPCGLAQISGYVANGDIDNTVDYVYGGDLKGNLWRFDLTGNNTNGWGVAKFATLKDGSSRVQPVTTAPELTLVNNMRMVFVGTGEYLGGTDIPGATNANVASSQTQTMYGLHDTQTALPDPLRASLQQQTITTSGSTRTMSSNTVDYATKNGWYIDLPSTGERLTTDPAVALSALVFTTNIPSSTVCQPGGSSWEYFINVKTGGVVDNTTVAWSGTFLANALGSRPVLIQLPSGKVVSLVRTSDAQTVKQDVPVNAPGSTPRRISWRELIN